MKAYVPGLRSVREEPNLIPAFLRTLLLAPLLVTHLAADPDPKWIPVDGFVQVSGADFTVHGQPWHFIGANLDVLHGEDRRASMTQVLDAMAADGLTVGRQWVVGEGDPGVCGPVQGASLFRYGPEVFFEDSYHQLDLLLAEARQRGIRLVLTLGNNWGDHGGIPMYLRWAGLPATDPEAFWSDPRIRAFYQAGVDHLLERRNTVTGVRYVDDPTILSWELMNESTTLTPEGAAARRVWITEMARHIKAKDANHLVAAGLLGYSMLSERREWVAVHQLPEIDYCDSHLYPQDDQQVMGWERLRDVIDDRAQLARFVVGKPLVLGEFGFRTSGAASWLGLPRAEWFSRLLDQARADGLAGTMVWLYQPFYGEGWQFGISVDRGDTDDVRGAFRSRASAGAAARPAVLNPRLQPGLGTTPLYDDPVLVRGRDEVHEAWATRGRRRRERLLRIQPEDYAEARFERFSGWKGGRIENVYGVGSGHVDYRFAMPRNLPAHGVLRIRARLSSEWPEPRNGGSPLRVLLDGQEVGARTLVPDDGLGRVEAVTVAGPGLLRSLAGGVHTLTFEVPETVAPHGLRIYGRPAAPTRPPPGTFGPIELAILRKP